MNLLSLLAQTTQLNDQTFFLPRQASQDAPQIDFAWNMILITTTIFFFIVVGAMTFFVIKYRRRTIGAHATSTVTHNTPLEIVWTFVPLVIVVAFFFVGFKGFMNYDNPPSNARIVDVQGSQWAFNFTYPNGSHSGELFVEEGVPVRLNLHSVDVLHALYIPVMRVQRNLVPFRQTVMWFVPVVHEPNKEGFPIFCTQYCGEGHSEMFSHCHVLSKEEYNEKMLELANPFTTKDKADRKIFAPYKDVGKILYEQNGCNSCHTNDGKKSTGPTWAGLWKSDVPFAAAPAAGGPPDDDMHELHADDSDTKWEHYLRLSMIKPSLNVVKDFGPMPQSFEGILSGTPENEEKNRAIIEYIKSIGVDPKAYKPAITIETNPELFDVEKTPLRDKENNPIHPESLAGIEARKNAAPGGAPRLPEPDPVDKGRTP